VYFLGRVFEEIEEYWVYTKFPHIPMIGDASHPVGNPKRKV
jgi:hypothetical protein